MAGVLAVVDGAILKCTKGLGVSRLHATTGPSVELEHHVLATINDYQPGVNVPPFRYCQKLHKDCSPLLPAPWHANLFSGVLVAPSIAGILPMTAELRCGVGGDITIISAGQSTLSVGQADRLIALQQALRELNAERKRFLATGKLSPEIEAALAAADKISGGLKLLDPLSSIGGKPGKYIRKVNPMSWIRSAHDNYKPTREKLYDRLLDSIASVRNEIRSIKGTRRPRRYRLGGAYRDLPAEGGERHHMPSKDASPLSKGSGPAIRMDTRDHYETASWGPSKKAKAYRARQKRLIEQGRFHDAQQMDIDDIRGKFGSKYDDAIHDAVEYTSRWPTG